MYTELLFNDPTNDSQFKTDVKPIVCFDLKNLRKIKYNNF